MCTLQVYGMNQRSTLLHSFLLQKQIHKSNHSPDIYVHIVKIVLLVLTANMCRLFMCIIVLFTYVLFKSLLIIM